MLICASPTNHLTSPQGDQPRAQLNHALFSFHLHPREVERALTLCGGRSDWAVGPPRRPRIRLLQVRAESLRSLSVHYFSPRVLRPSDALLYYRNEFPQIYPPIASSHPVPFGRSTRSSSCWGKHLTTIAANINHSTANCHHRPQVGGSFPQILIISSGFSAI